MGFAAQGGAALDAVTLDAVTLDAVTLDAVMLDDAFLKEFAAEQEVDGVYAGVLDKERVARGEIAPGHCAVQGIGRFVGGQAPGDEEGDDDGEGIG